VVISQVAGLAHPHRVKKPLCVFTSPGILIPSKLTITGRAHVLGVVLSVDMWTFGNLHHVLV
jgi:hypothetical protein